MLVDHLGDEIARFLQFGERWRGRVFLRFSGLGNRQGEEADGQDDEQAGAASGQGDLR